MNETIEQLKQINRNVQRIVGSNFPVVVSSTNPCPQGVYYWLIKGNNVNVVSIFSVNGDPYPSEVVNFINLDFPEGITLPIMFSNIVLSSGRVLVGRDNF